MKVAENGCRLAEEFTIDHTVFYDMYISKTFE